MLSGYEYELANEIHQEHLRRAERTRLQLMAEATIRPIRPADAILIHNMHGRLPTNAIRPYNSTHFRHIQIF